MAIPGYGRVYTMAGGDASRGGDDPEAGAATRDLSGDKARPYRKKRDGRRAWSSGPTSFQVSCMVRQTPDALRYYYGVNVSRTCSLNTRSCPLGYVFRHILIILFIALESSVGVALRYTRSCARGQHAVIFPSPSAQPRKPQ